MQHFFYSFLEEAGGFFKKKKVKISCIKIYTKTSILLDPKKFM